LHDIAARVKGAAFFPLLSEEGWLRDQQKLRSILSRADGVVSNHN
jgi:hypothetical protein